MRRQRGTRNSTSGEVPRHASLPCLEAQVNRLRPAIKPRDSSESDRPALSPGETHLVNVMMNSKVHLGSLISGPACSAVQALNWSIIPRLC